MRTGEEEPPGCPDSDFEQCALRGSRAYAAAHADEIGELILLDYVANDVYAQSGRVHWTANEALYRRYAPHHPFMAAQAPFRRQMAD